MEVSQNKSSFRPAKIVRTETLILPLGILIIILLTLLLRLSNLIYCGAALYTRNALPRFEMDGDWLKFNPLTNWTSDDIHAYFIVHDLPPNPLKAQGYLSIGWSLRSSVVRPRKDSRSGRGSGWEKTECGIPTSVGDGDPNRSVFEAQPLHFCKPISKL